MFERYRGGERALLVHVVLPHQADDRDEFEILARASGVTVLTVVDCQRRLPDPKYFIGHGKALVVKQAVDTHQADVVLINCDLSPSQEKQLEHLLCCRLLSRSGLILAIFAQRARTFEGKLQVELAQLHHWQTRLIRGWTHLERQKGGIGLRGPGETQLELDRRMIRIRIKTIQSRLAKVRSQRQQNRKFRSRSALPVVALVGYTNAGKSTLFNALTHSNTLAEDKLFATLDPLMRRMPLSDGHSAILADTVGFLQRLPHGLIEAFKATLEELQAADLIVEVLDLADPNFRSHQAVIVQVLQEIGADHLPRMTVFNKIDALAATVDSQCIDGRYRVWISAATGQGLAVLQQAMAAMLHGSLQPYVIDLPLSQARWRAHLHAKHVVTQEQFDADRHLWEMHVMMPPRDHQALLKAMAADTE